MIKKTEDKASELVLVHRIAVKSLPFQLIPQQIIQTGRQGTRFEPVRYNNGRGFASSVL
jgi:hypothetical protein